MGLVWSTLVSGIFSLKIPDLILKCLSRAVNLTHSHTAYPSIFDELSEEQIRAAKRHLSQPIEKSGNRANRRVFNLDASKLL